MRALSLILVWYNVFTKTTGTQAVSSIGIYRSRSLRYPNFIRHENRYLKVLNIGRKTVREDLDCSLDCLSNLGCYSINVEASTKDAENIWCELLASDKYNNTMEFKTNQSSHHFSISSPCSMQPCKNRATRVAKYQDGTFACLCAPGFGGKHCEKACKMSDGWAIFHESRYKFFEEMKTWSEAEQHCKLLNASLVEIHSQEEDAFLETIIPDHTLNQVYIGANDIDEEGVWVWVNGGDLSGYSNWSPTSPSDTVHSENCGTIMPYEGYKWNDYPCTWATSFICETCYHSS